MVLKLSEEVQCQDFETFGYFQNYFYWVLGGFFLFFCFGWVTNFTMKVNRLSQNELTHKLRIQNTR